MSVSELLDIGGQFCAPYDIRQGFRHNGTSVIEWRPVHGAGRRIEGASMILTPSGTTALADFGQCKAPTFTGGADTLDAPIACRPQFNAANRYQLFLGVVWKSSYAAASFPVLAGIYSGATAAQRQYLITSYNSIQTRPVYSIWEPGPTERAAIPGTAGAYATGNPNCSELWLSGVAGSLQVNGRTNQSAVVQTALASVMNTATTEVFRVSNAAAGLQGQATIAAVLLAFTMNTKRTADEFLAWAQRDWKTQRTA